MKKFLIAVLLAAALVLPIGCRDGNQPGEKAQKVTIYMSGDYIRGSDDSYVKTKIEEKFFQDTGYRINLSVQLYSTGDFNDNISPQLASGTWDAAVSYLGQAGIDEIVIKQNAAMELSDLVDAYGPDIGNLIDREAWNAVTTLDDKVYGIPSLNKTKQYGLLVRKDWMEQVGYTDVAGEATTEDLGPVNTPPAAGQKKHLVTIDDFTDMLRRFKAQIEGCKAPLLGYPWDVERVLTVGPFGDAGYTFRTLDSEGKLIPGALGDSYEKTLSYEYMWQKEGLWESDNTTRPLTERESAFVNGQAGVYCVSPNVIDLIRMTRLVKEADPDAAFAMLDPLFGVDENGNATGKSGFMEEQRAFSCMVINKNSKNAELLIRYLNWLYADVENYELAAFGVKGEHWMDAGEGFYTYPEGKEDAFLINPPYSGAYALLEMEEFSYRVLDTYTEQEKAWLAKAENVPTFKNVAEGMLFISMEKQVAEDYQTAENNFYSDLIAKVWSGSVNPTETSAGVTKFRTEVEKYREKAADYLSWLNLQYQAYVELRGKTT